MPRYIDAEKLKEYVWEKSSHMICEWDTAGVVNAIDMQESADVAPVRHGEWFGTVCTACGESTSFYFNCDYCPNCGAKMDGERGADHDA